MKAKPEEKRRSAIDKVLSKRIYNKLAMGHKSDNSIVRALFLSQKYCIGETQQHHRCHKMEPNDERIRLPLA